MQRTWRHDRESEDPGKSLGTFLRAHEGWISGTHLCGTVLALMATQNPPLVATSKSPTKLA
jgi:hypothetical protein